MSPARKLAVMAATLGVLCVFAPVGSASAACTTFNFPFDGTACVNDITAVAGTPFSGELLTVSIPDADGNATAVAINWGDGSAVDHVQVTVGSPYTATHTFPSSGTYTVTGSDDSGFGISATGTATVRDPGPCGEADVIHGTPGNDTINGTEGDDVICAGGGNDRINGLGGNDVIYGGPGNDVLTGGSGDDQLYGEDGLDVLRGGRGDDVQSGGAGVDTVDYSNRNRRMDVSLDGVANDGQAGEQDNVGDDVENIRGGAGNDKLTGDAQANRLDGNGGNDELDGLGGSDTLVGGPGADAFNGGAGLDTADYSAMEEDLTVTLDGVANDGDQDGSGEGDDVGTDVERVYGGDGDDTLVGPVLATGGRRLYGGPGNDTITGGRGRDVLSGGTGNDTIHADETVLGWGARADAVDCGAGTGDVLVGDALDLVSAIACEDDGVV